MNRRATLAKLMGRTSKKEQRRQASAATLGGGALDPYTGPWGAQQAAHLLRRTTFGPTKAEIQTATTDGLAATLATLLADQPLPDPPVYFNYGDDPEAGLGETWVDAGVDRTNLQLVGARVASLHGWHYGLFNESGMSIREQMTLFWHNHFVIANNNDARVNYRYITLLRENAMGNFRDLVKGITIDPGMLTYLNGNQNTAVAPNENYARELLELFTIGKGELAGPGDYTTFTEEDVVAMAKVLTGWVNVNRQTEEVGSYFVPNRHDRSTKQLSHRFNNITIANADEEEYLHLIDIIFQQEEVARFISRKLYRWFVHYNIDDQIELDIIEPMAQLLIQSDYEIKPVLNALLCSEHFFAAEGIGCMIKHPIGFLFSIVNTFGVISQNLDLISKYYIWLRLFRAMDPLGMNLYAHPDVAGWKAFYQAPLYYRTWINSASLPVRMQMAEALVNGFRISNQNFVRIDVLAFVEGMDNPSDINALLAEMSGLLYARPLTQEQIDYLKDILIPGLPDFEWGVEYGEYLGDPTNPDLRAAIESKLQNLVLAMLNLSEFYLS
ncbi:MAG: DUF1800 domain-containing protein [Bacteroidota bacterium]